MNMNKSKIDFSAEQREKLAGLLEKSPYLDVLGGLLDYETAADDLITHGVTVQKWIPVTERLPEKDGYYLIYGCGGWRGIYGFAKDGRKLDKYDFNHRWENVWYSYNLEHGFSISDAITHWMPLPDAPKGDKNGRS